ncbi:hypothetical protein B0H11DRAFT_2051398 [Mycena galericulata]|nr:hypothetical protein B0H11DRAFT_2051398 [Mycena galericulata]
MSGVAIMLGTAHNSSRNFPTDQELTSSMWVTGGAESTGRRHNSVCVDSGRGWIHFRTGESICSTGMGRTGCAGKQGLLDVDRAQSAVDTRASTVTGGTEDASSTTTGGTEDTPSATKEKRKESKGSKPALIVKPNQCIGRAMESTQSWPRWTTPAASSSDHGEAKGRIQIQINPKSRNKVEKREQRQKYRNNGRADIANAERHEGREEK